MQLDLSLFPQGLNRYLADSVSAAAQKASGIDLDYLNNRLQEHLDRTKVASQANPMVHVALAEAVVNTYSVLIAQWDTLPEPAVPWLKAAMLYFVEVDDDDHDFDSPIGFEDDVEVLNACLRMAGLEELCLNPEDFD